MTLLELVAELIALRKKPTSQARFGQYPALLQALRAAIADCADPATLEQALARDSGYHLPSGERQYLIERLLEFGRTPQRLRLYARQLDLFGDARALGEPDSDVAERVAALEAEAEQREKAQRD